MKKISLFMLGMMAISFAASCSDDKDDNNVGYNPSYGAGIAPQVVSVTPTDGATDIDTINQIVVTYDRNIYLPPHVTIRVNTEFVDSGVTAVGNKMYIPVKTIGNTNYNVTIMKPSVRDSLYTFAQEYSFSFKTKLYNLFDPTRFDIADVPVNPNATPETVKLYKFLKENFGKKMLAGAMANVAWNTGEAQQMYELTGKYPAINCFDFVHHASSAPLNPSNWINYTNTQVVEDWANNGGIVACMWHWNVPRNEAGKNNYSDYSFYAENTDFSARNATRSSRWEYTIAMRDIDIIADYLLALQEKGIPVIWRPLHEARGNYGKWGGTGSAWFWWGTSGPVQFKKLWKQMYDRFAEKGVNNCIWVWTSDGLGEVNESDADWYPGDDCVDIIARDYYCGEKTDLYHTSLKEEFECLYDMTGGKKIIALSEGDAIPSIYSQFADGVVWSWCMPWYGQDANGVDYFNSSYNTAEFMQDLFDSEFVITRDEVPSFK